MKRMIIFLLLLACALSPIYSVAYRPATKHRSAPTASYQIKTASRSSYHHSKSTKKSSAKKATSSPKSTKPSIPDSTYTVMAEVPSSIVDNDTLQLTTWQDTVYTIHCIYKQQRITPPEQLKSTPSGYIQGHHLQGWVGVGYGSMGYSLQDQQGAKAGKEWGSVAAKVQLNYAFYFTENWGLALGVGFSNYVSYGTLNTNKQWIDQIDTDNEPYTHIVRTANWRERQATYMIDIPLMIQMQYPIAKQLRIYAGLGAKIGLPIHSDWNIYSGAIEHLGYYPQWNLLLEQTDKYDFYSEQAASFGQDKHNLSLRWPAASVMAEIGLSYPIADRLDLIAAVFFDYTCNNLRSSYTAQEQNIGWRREDQMGAHAYRNHTFMNAYQGMVQSEYISALHPWAVGIKVGLSWHPKPKPKKIIPQYEQILVCDTSYVLQERTQRVEKERPVAVQQIEQLMKKAIIWFDLDSTEPKLKPKDILNHIAQVLIDHPQQHILVYGHASKEGNEDYNQRLSEQRAQAIVDRLITLGVNPNQITQRGFAASVAYEQAEHDISLDRRVEIIPIWDEQ